MVETIQERQKHQKDEWLKTRHATKKAEAYLADLKKPYPIWDPAKTTEDNYIAVRKYGEELTWLINKFKTEDEPRDCIPTNPKHDWQAKYD